MPRIKVNFAESGDMMRKRADVVIGQIRDLRRALPSLGIPSEDPATGQWSGDLARAIGYLDEIASLVEEQKSRNRESFMGKV
jgi:hypothetical protein